MLYRFLQSIYNQRKEKLMNLTEKQIFAAINKYGSARKAALALNIPKSTFSDAVRRARADKITEKKAIKPVIVKAPRRKGEVKRYILTSAQDGSLVHPFFHVLKVYAEHLGAQLMVSGYTYNKSLFEEHDKHKVTFASELREYMTNDRVIIGDRVVFCGEMNILPTSPDPLLGLKTYTEDKIGIVPHARIRMESVPMIKGEPSKIVMTTGTVTKRNYVQKKAGILSEFHHTYGAVLVEVQSNGEFFCRHLMGEENTGNFYDLSNYVTIDGVTTGHRVAALTHGDLHYEKLNKISALAAFGFDIDQKKTVTNNCLIDNLKPYEQYFHDTIDFTYRNSHNINDPHFRYEMWVNGTESVEQTMKDAANFLMESKRDWCKSVVVESNHDTQLLRWLKTGDYRTDPPNAIFFLETQLGLYKAMRNKDKKYNVFWESLKRYNLSIVDSITFVPEDVEKGHKVYNTDIQGGVHGHLGSHGTRASSKSFSKMGTKMNIAHAHHCSIFDGVWTAGVLGNLDMGYNKGLSAWSPTSIVTYLNGKRAMLTMSSSGRFYAE